jgi:hypothetical protein
MPIWGPVPTLIDTAYSHSEKRAVATGSSTQWRSFDSLFTKETGIAFVCLLIAAAAVILQNKLH